MTERYDICKNPGGGGWAVYDAMETHRTGVLEIVEFGLSRADARQRALILNGLG